MNTSDVTIDLSGVHFTAGLDSTFPAGSTLDAGARVLLVRDAAPFSAVHGGAVNVGGVFQSLTNLDNGGELLTLLAANGSTIASFTYDDDAPWPNDADGNGFSLTLINPAAHPDYASPLNWRASSILNGTPGMSDATTFTGDPNADADHDGLTARMEYALGTSDTDGTPSDALRRDAATGTLHLTRALAADNAALIVESSTDLASWSSNWPLQRRDRTPDGLETLRFTPPPAAPPRVYLRARLP